MLQLADTLSMPKVHHNKDAVRPILRACFSFLAAFVHKHKANQVEVWADRHIIEANLGYDVEAETALAEVRTNLLEGGFVDVVWRVATTALATTAFVHSVTKPYQNRCPLLRPLQDSCCTCAVVACQVILDNRAVASTVDDSLFWKLTSQIEAHGFDYRYLTPICRSMKVWSTSLNAHLTVNCRMCVVWA